MENVIRGFISPSGVLIRVARTGFEGCNEVETVAKSICQNIEHVSVSYGKCIVYLIEVFGYVYVEWSDLDHPEIVDLRKPTIVTEAQQMKLLQIMREVKQKDFQKLLKR